MPDDLDALLAYQPKAKTARAPKPAADDLDALLSYQPRAAAKPAAPPAPVNLRPREHTDEELGIGTGPLQQTTGELGTHAAFVNPPQEVGQPIPGAGPQPRLPGELAGDPTAQNVVASVLTGGLGKLVGPVLGKVGIGNPIVVRGLQGAGEGAAATKMFGGTNKEALLGAGLGGALGAAGGAVEGAPGRVRERALKDVVQGEGEGAKPPKSMVRKLARAEGPEGERLAAAMEEDPELEKTLATAAARHPEKALDFIQKRIEQNDQTVSPVYKAITAAGGVKLTSVTAPMEKLRLGYLEKGQTQAAEAVQREMDSLVKNYGGKVPENATITGEQLRGIRNEIGAAAFANQMTSRALKTQVKRDLYGTYRGAIEGAVSDLGELSPTAADVFKAANRKTSILLPMRDVLKERLMNEQTGSESLVGRMNEAAKEGDKGPLAMVTSLAIPPAKRLAGQAARHVDYALSRVQAPTASAAAPVVPLAVAKTAKEPPRVVRGLQWFGRPATAAERNAAGLPAALEHAINTNDPNLGHAALSLEVLGH